MQTADQQAQDDSVASEMRKYLYKNWAATRQPMLDDVAKTGKTWGVGDYITSPWQSMKMGATAAGANLFGDPSLGSVEAGASRDKLMKQAEDAAIAKHDGKKDTAKKMFIPWLQMQRHGELQP